MKRRVQSPIAETERPDGVFRETALLELRAVPEVATQLEALASALQGRVQELSARRSDGPSVREKMGAVAADLRHLVAFVEGLREGGDSQFLADQSREIRRIAVRIEARVGPSRAETQ